MYPMPPVDQFVLRKVGFELSYRRRSGEVTNFVLQFSKIKQVVRDIDDDRNAVEKKRFDD